MCRIKNNRLALEALPQASTQQTLFFSVLYKMALPRNSAQLGSWGFQKEFSLFWHSLPRQQSPNLRSILKLHPHLTQNFTFDRSNWRAMSNNSLRALCKFMRNFLKLGCNWALSGLGGSIVDSYSTFSQYSWFQSTTRCGSPSPRPPGKWMTKGLALAEMPGLWNRVCKPICSNTPAHWLGCGSSEVTICNEFNAFEWIFLFFKDR